MAPSARKRFLFTYDILDDFPTSIYNELEHSNIMFESGYYPAGAEFDRNAPHNEVTREVESTGYIEVEYTTTCQPFEVSQKIKELDEALARNRKVNNHTVTSSQIDIDELSVFVDIDLNVIATAYGNSIDNRYPEPTDEDIAYAVDEQWEEALQVDGWEAVDNRPVRFYKL